MLTDPMERLRHANPYPDELPELPVDPLLERFMAGGENGERAEFDSGVGEPRRRWIRPGALSAGAAVVVALAVVVGALVLLGHGAGSHSSAPPVGGSAPLSGTLPRGAAWYSEAEETTWPTAVNGLKKPQTMLVRKWITWQGNEYQRTTIVGQPSFHGGGYLVGDGVPGFGDWDPLDVHTLPPTAAGIRQLLRSGRLEHGQYDRAERTSPFIWLAQLAAMLADNVNTPTARAAALEVMNRLPGVVRIGSVQGARGRRGVSFAERSDHLRVISIATGSGCVSASGGAGCTGVGNPAGRFELVVDLNAATGTVLGLKTTAVTAIPSARIRAGAVLFQVIYLAGKVVAHPPLPPLPKGVPPTIESVPWRLGHVAGRRVTVRWQSGTCRPGLPPRPTISAVETASTVTIRVLVHVERAGTAPCAGVGLSGTLSTQLAQPVGTRKIIHGPVTDRDR